MDNIRLQIPAWGQLLGWWSLTALILWIRCEGIHMEGDPIVYARLAFLDSQGLPPWQEWTFTTRTGLLAPLSWIISWAGVSTASLLAWPVAAFFLLVTAIWIRRNSLPVHEAWILTGLLLLPWPSAYAVRLFPDALMMIFASLAILSIPEKMVTRQEIVWRSVLIGLFLTISLLCKLTVLYLVPVWMILVYQDETQRRNWRVHVGALITSASLLGILFLADSPFFDRFINIDQDHNLSPFSYSWDQPEAMINRLLLEPFQSFWANPGIAILIFPVLLGLLRPGKESRWMTWGFLLLLALHWVGSSSLTRYTPLPADPRMWILMSIPMMLLSASGLQWLWSEHTEWPRPFLILWGVILVLVGVGAVLMRNPGYHLALLVGLLLLPVRWQLNFRIISFLILMSTWLGYQGWNRSEAYYQRSEQQLIRGYLSEEQPILVDPVLKFGEFLYTDDSEQLTPWPADIPVTPGTLFLWNGTRAEQANLFSDRIQIPPYLSELEQSWELIASDSLFDLRLYQLPERP